MVARAEALLSQGERGSKGVNDRLLPKVSEYGLLSRRGSSERK